MRCTRIKHGSDGSCSSSSCKNFSLLKPFVLLSNTDRCFTRQQYQSLPLSVCGRCCFVAVSVARPNKMPKATALVPRRGQQLSPKQPTTSEALVGKRIVLAGGHQLEPISTSLNQNDALKFYFIMSTFYATSLFEFTHTFTHFNTRRLVCSYSGMLTPAFFAYSAHILGTRPRCTSGKRQHWRLT